MGYNFNIIKSINTQMRSKKFNEINTKIIYLYFFLATVILLKIFYAYFIPLNINPRAPHDDTLFYRLGLNISNGLWLGTYDPTTLIKGITYPLFIAASIKSLIPLRVLEAILTCISSLYFIASLYKYFNKKVK